MIDDSYSASSRSAQIYHDTDIFGRQSPGGVTGEGCLAGRTKRRWGLASLSS